MKLGIVLRTTGPTPRFDLDFVLEAERLGFDSAWTSEAWGGDAVTTVSWLLARTTKIKEAPAFNLRQFIGTGVLELTSRCARKPNHLFITNDNRRGAVHDRSHRKFWLNRHPDLTNKDQIDRGEP